MRRYVTPSFERAVKKWHPRQKADLDEAVHTIASNPEWGEAKIGDLFGIRVYKFHSSNQLCSWYTVSGTRIV
ncbi:MAG: type II toxin-antitoxin system RelE/ParE family toxin [Nitrosomonas sp. PRO4]|nr:type II toxin-antitoxin system RelE/ParE family toxin [Nitrosomonas sp. PRO4]